MKPVVVNSQNFELEVVKSKLPVLVDFWAAWCGPCRMIAPVVEELAKEYDGKLKVAKIDVDANQDIATTFGIMSIPTLLIFNSGRVADQLVGAVPKSLVIDKITRVLERN
jgi:thioredoxin 1